MTSQLTCPLTVKMRIGWDEKKPNADSVSFFPFFFLPCSYCFTFFSVCLFLLCVQHFGFFRLFDILIIFIFPCCSFTRFLLHSSVFSISLSFNVVLLLFHNPLNYSSFRYFHVFIRVQIEGLSLWSKKYRLERTLRGKFRTVTGW